MVWPVTAIRKSNLRFASHPLQGSTKILEQAIDHDASINISKSVSVTVRIFRKLQSRNISAITSVSSSASALFATDIDKLVIKQDELANVHSSSCFWKNSIENESCAIRDQAVGVPLRVNEAVERHAVTEGEPDEH